MGKGRPRAVEKGVLGHCPYSSSSGALNIPQAPVYYPTEEEFSDPLEFIDKIRLEAESYGICRIVPPKSWKPPFALDLDSFTFPTKSQAIHRLQARTAGCDPKTFELEYNRFLDSRFGRKPKKRVIFEGGELDLCKLFNAVKRYGGYSKVVKEKKWGDVFRFLSSVRKISECSKHVLCQLYLEHLFDYEEHLSQLNDKNKLKDSKRACGDRKTEEKGSSISDVKRKGKNSQGKKIKMGKLVEKEEFDQICEQCQSGLHGEVMLLCDRCDKGWHLYCLSPPLEQVPLGNWYCLDCVNSNKDSFGFVPGKRFTLEAFRRLADRAKRKWFGTMPATRSQIEKQFWEIVEGLVGEVEVKYGSDLDTSIYGSGFPRMNDPPPSSIEPAVWKKYSNSPWNLNNLPKLQGSMLRAVHGNIAGVMVPWLYVGMLFSSFCWHFEDHCFYSMNYLHWGEPKCWYSVPGSEAHSFEQVMRKTLPDLFDTQPDLLFQLVTMLNPSVLQDSGVPVYGVLQEPGNFVITFPRSFHGGFNFGLNCAEAVNFAPADWLPHGGYGADLYRFYHKAAVLSHEELLCVVSKGNCHSKVLPYLKAEMLRTFTKENKFREKIWRSGVIKSSPLSPRKHPEYVGTEEDPTCIICHQYLYLSAVVCSCRPSAFLCLEHWEHFCECKPRKHRLLYRHTLADLNDLLMTVTTALTGTCSLEKPQHQFSLSIEANIVTKEVQGGFVTFAQLAEDWLSRSCDFLKNTFSDAACISLLKEAEQFIWAGHEMDSVRNMANSLNEAQKWAEGVRNCLSRMETNLGHSKNDKKKVCLSEVDNLLRVAPPCNEPTHPKLKAYAEEARILVSQIKSALSSSSQIVELEALHSKAAKLPIYLDECTRLRREISSAKAWVDRVRECLSKKKPASLEIDVLYELKTQMLGLSASVPEMELLSVLLSQVESWQTRSREFLNGPITLQDLESFLQDVNNFTVSIPELKLLHQYRSEALCWISQLNAVIEKNQDREDHNNIVEELTCLMKKGSSLRVQVNELSLLDAELRKSCCREKALKALSTQMTLEFIQELISEAASLQIESEKLFIDVTGVLAAAVSWEERAKHILTNCGHMSEFEEVIRTSKDIFVILPSRQDVMDALTMAESWIRASQPFLMSTVSSEHVSNSLLKVDALKELVSQSKLLKVSLKAPEVLQSILKSVEAWENESYSLLEHINSFLNTHAMDPTIENGLSMRIIELLSRVTSATKAGLSLGFHFEKMSELDGASCVLQWSLKTLSLCTSAASLKEVNSLISDADHLLAKFAHNIFVCELISGLRWVKQALMVIPEPQNLQRYKLRDVEVVLEEAKRINISFPMMVARLVTAIEKHKSWQKQVEAFFSSRGKQSWCSLLALKKVGESDALDTPELDKITSETEKINKWILQCKYIVAPSPDDVGSLSHALTKIKETLDRALCIYRNPEGGRVGPFCLCCSSDAEDEELACLMCKDRYHQSCMGPSLALEPDVKDYICPFCLRMESGIISGNGGWPLISRRKRPRLKTLVELLQDSQDFYAGVEERDLVEEVVERALTCKLYLTGTVDRVLTYTQKNLTSVSQILLTSVKAVAIAGVYDHEDSCNLELALTRNSWKIRVKKLLEGPTKPYIQSVQQLLNEGVAVNVPSEDQYMQELRQVKNISLQWASVAKKVASDYGVLELDEVFKLIKEGENLPIHLDKELKLLKARSELYCICRKPYDQRDMIACDRCDEWYHFDCINLVGPPPKTFICAACNPPETDSISIASLTDREDRSSTEEGPQTPPPRHSELKRRRLAKTKSSLQQKMRFATDLSNILRFSSETDHLWRKSQRPLSRKTRKRSKLDSLSRYPRLQQ